MKNTKQNALTLIIFLELFNTINCVYYLRNGQHPDHPGKCFFDNHVLELGDKVPVKGPCCQLTCEENSMYSIYCCGKEGEEPKCPILKTLTYPDCCSVRYCPANRR